MSAVEDEEGCNVCGLSTQEELLVLCDGCDRSFHTFCHMGCACGCKQKPRGLFGKKPAVPEGDWFCKFCLGRIPKQTSTDVSSVFAFGDNQYGQLGLPVEKDVTSIKTPVQIDQLQNVSIRSIASGETFTLVLTLEGEVYSVGTGYNGELGHNDIVHEKLTHFRRIEAFSDEKRSNSEGIVSRIECGRDFAVAITSEGHIYSWGYGELGQLGHQENKNKKIPKKISALREMEIPVNLVACGDDFVLMTSGYLDNDDQFNVNQPGVFMCQGTNAQGQLGDGKGKNQWVPQLLNKENKHLKTTPEEATTSNPDDSPMEFLLGRDLSQLKAGRAHSVAVSRSFPGLWAWGHGEAGQLGHPKPPPVEGQSKFFKRQFVVPVPRYVQALRNTVISQVECGANHTIALADGVKKVFAWGSNEFGQIGKAKPANAEANVNFFEFPVEISTLSNKNIKSVHCGRDHNVALTEDGALFSWGNSEMGQTGVACDNKTSYIDVPTKISNLPKIKFVKCGPYVTFAVENSKKAMPVKKQALKESSKKRKAPATGGRKKKK